MEITRLSRFIINYEVQGEQAAIAASRRVKNAYNATTQDFLRGNISLENATKKQIKTFQNYERTVAGAFLPGVKSFGGFVKNLRLANTALKSNTLAGKATAQSIMNMSKNAETYTANSRGMLTSLERTRAMMHAVGVNVTSLASHYQNLFKNMQWTGRQMMVGLSVPIAGAALVASKAWNKVNEQVVRLQKVMNEADFNKLGGSDGVLKMAKSLGHEFAVVDEMVVAVMGDFAAMGYSSKSALEGMTKLTLEVSSLGDVDISDATKMVRSVYELFGGSISATKDILSQFNTIENQTAINLKDLVPTFPEVASAAKNFGLTAAETAAMMAAMYEKGIPANEVATSLKYSMASLIHPTGQAADSIMQLQASVPKAGETLKNIVSGALRGRPALVGFAQAFSEISKVKGPTAAQEFLVEIVGKRQANRMMALFQSIMEGEKELADTTKKNADDYTSDYARAINATGNDFATLHKTRKTMEREIALKQQSDAFKYQQSIRDIKSAIAEIGKTIQPVIQGMASKLGGVLKRFQEFLSGNKGFQKLLVGVLTALAGIGPAMVVLAGVGTATSTVVKGLGKLIPSLGYASSGFLNAGDAILQARKGLLDAGGALFTFDGNVKGNLKSMKKLIAESMASSKASREDAKGKTKEAIAIDELTLALTANTRAWEANFAAQNGGSLPTRTLTPTARSILPPPVPIEQQLVETEQMLASSTPGWTAAGRRIANSRVQRDQISQMLMGMYRNNPNSGNALNQILGPIGTAERAALLPGQPVNLASEAQDVFRRMEASAGGAAADPFGLAAISARGAVMKDRFLNTEDPIIASLKARGKSGGGLFKRSLRFVDKRAAYAENAMMDATKPNLMQRASVKMFGSMQSGLEKVMSKIPKGGLIGSMLGGTGEAASVSSVVGGFLAPIAPIAAIVAAILGMIVVLAAVSGHWKNFWNGLKKGFKPFIGFMKGAWDSIKKGVSTLWGALKTLFKPFQDTLNSIFGMMSGKGKSGAGSTWKTMGVIIGSIGSAIGLVARILGYIFEILAKVIGFFAKIFAWVLKIVLAISPFVLSLKLVAKIIGLIAANWKKIVNSVIDGVNKIIETINKIPGIEIPLIPKIGQQEEAQKDFEKLVGKTVGQKREMIIKTKVEEELGKLDADTINNLVKNGGIRKRILEIKTKVENKVDNAADKMIVQQEKLRQLEAERATLQEKTRSNQQLEAELMQKVYDLNEQAKQPGADQEAIALEKTKIIEKINTLREQQSTALENNAKAIDKVKKKLDELRSYDPGSMSVISEDSLYQASALQKQISETETSISDLEQKIAKAKKAQGPGWLLSPAGVQAKTELANLKSNLNNFVMQRQRILKSMWNNMGETMRKKFRSFDKFKAYIDVEYKFDENTVGKTPSDRIQKLLATAPQHFHQILSDADQAAIDAAQKFWDAFKTKMDEVTNKLKESAMKAFEAGAKQRLSYYDDQIKKIDELEKAEQDLYETQKYLADRKKLLDQYATTSENYRRNRALAIYEGRYDDARMMDLQYQSDSKANREDLQNLDDERNKALVQKERNAQKEKLNAQKEALQEQLDLQKEHLQNMLDVLTQYTPKNVGELQNMIEQMNTFLEQEGFPKIADTFGSATELWASATEAAQKDVIDAAYWAGRGAATAAVSGIMGETPEWIDWFGKLKPKDQQAVENYLDNLNKSNMEQTSTGPSWVLQSLLNGGTKAKKKHSGGMIGSTQDSPSDVPAVLQAGEFVIQRKAVQKLGTGFLHGINKYHEGGLVGQGIRGMLFGQVGLLFASMLAQKKAMADAISAGMSNVDMSKLAGTGGNGQAEAQPNQGPVDPNDLMITQFQNLLAFLFPRSYNWIMNGHTRDKGDIGAGSFHSTGQALDIGGGISDPEGAQAIWEFLVPRVEKFDITEMIFQHMMFDKGPGWHPYGPDDHMGHIHVAVGTRLDELVANNPNFFTPLMRGGKIPIDNMPALLHKGEVVLPAQIVRNIENANNAASGGGDVYITVDNFIGQRQWFEQMMKEYNVKTLPAEHRRHGTINRVISSRKDNKVRYV